MLHSVYWPSTTLINRKDYIHPALTGFLLFILSTALLPTWYKVTYSRNEENVHMTHTAHVLCGRGNNMVVGRELEQGQRDPE